MKTNKFASKLIFATVALVVLFVAATADYSSIEHSHDHGDHEAHDDHDHEKHDDHDDHDHEKHDDHDDHDDHDHE